MSIETEGNRGVVNRASRGETMASAPPDIEAAYYTPEVLRYICSIFTVTINI